MSAESVDALLVLGAGVNADGSLPALARSRVERAAELFRGGAAPRVIFSGRCGLMGRDPAVSEAAAMAAYATELGVPPAALLIEDRSKDTIGNAYFTKREFLTPHGWTAVRVITSDFHVGRAETVLRKIWGAGYRIAFDAVPSRHGRVRRLHRRVDEWRLSVFLARWLARLPDGDDQAIERFIWQRHPAYASSGRVTLRAMVKGLLRRGARGE
jgi:uncharacterized SAM-binding protein YcdF (DUF218 family)